MDHSCLLMTRPKASAQRFVAAMDPTVLAGVDLCFSPLIDVMPVPFETDLSAYAGVILSSANAVGFLDAGAGRPAFCVGKTTAEAAEQRGWRVMQTGQDADELVAVICDKGAQGPLVHLSGTHRRGAIAERLTAFGIPTECRPIYDQRLLDLSDEAKTRIEGEQLIILPLFSPRTAAHFANQVKKMQHVVGFAISPAVAAAVDGLPFDELHIALAPSADEMREGVEMLLGRHSCP